MNTIKQEILMMQRQTEQLRAVREELEKPWPAEPGVADSIYADMLKAESDLLVALATAVGWCKTPQPAARPVEAEEQDAERWDGQS